MNDKVSHVSGLTKVAEILPLYVSIFFMKSAPSASAASTVSESGSVTIGSEIDVIVAKTSTFVMSR